MNSRILREYVFNKVIIIIIYKTNILYIYIQIIEYYYIYIIHILYYKYLITKENYRNVCLIIISLKYMKMDDLLNIIRVVQISQ